MMKLKVHFDDFFIIVVVLFLIILPLFLFHLNQQDSRKINELLKEDQKKYKVVVDKIDSLKKEKLVLDSSVCELKRYIDKKEQALSINIQSIKNRSNAQIRNVSDSSFIYLLRELQPK